MKTSRLLFACLALIVVIAVACATPTGTVPTGAPSTASSKPPAASPPGSAVCPITAPGGRPKLTICPEALKPLADLLKSYGLNVEDVNTTKTATYALFQSGSIVLMTAPLKKPAGDLNSSNGAIIGVLQAMRALPLSGKQELPNDVYLVGVKQGLIFFVSNTNRFSPSLKADLRTMTRNVTDPETIITIKDICYSWQTTQVCTLPSPTDALTPDESKDMKERVSATIQELVNAKLVSSDDLNASGAIPDVEGSAAVDKRQASALIVPIKNYPQNTNGNQPPTATTLLGGAKVILPIDVGKLVPAGTYAVKAQSSDSGSFYSIDKTTVINLPAKFIQVRGPSTPAESPMAIIVGIHFWLCFWEC